MKNSPKTSKKEESPKGLPEIRRQLKALDAARADKGLAEDRRLEIETAIRALKEAERVAIAKAEKQIVSDLETSVASLKDLSASIRTIVARYTKANKVIDHVASLLKAAADVVDSVL
ncbi:MAG: hypothetical protein HUJ89_07670 [Bacteroidales bacterium]|nr:hypothetical protein [Bacteroidales bacterium]